MIVTDCDEDWPVNSFTRNGVEFDGVGEGKSSLPLNSLYNIRYLFSSLKQCPVRLMTDRMLIFTIDGFTK